MNDIEKRIQTLESEVFKLKSEKFCNQSTKLPIIERVKSYEDACCILNKWEFFDDCIDSIDIIAYKKLKLIIEALNEGWKPNWYDINELKYYPYFSIEKYGGKNGSAGLGSCSAYNGFGYSYTSIGSRLCFKTSELAKYAGQQFKDLYEDYFFYK